MRLALIYRQDFPFYSGHHFDNTLYNFYFKALKRSPRLTVSYHPFTYKEGFDVSNIDADALLVCENPLVLPRYFRAIENFGKPVIVRVGDPHGYSTMVSPYKYLPDYCFGFYSQNLFYKYFPRTLRYKMIVHGLEPSLYQNVAPFETRIKDRILNSGRTAQFPEFVSRLMGLRNPGLNAWTFYRLRTLCNRLPYVDYTETWKHEYVGDRYPELLTKYRAAIAATTTNASAKYWEIPAASCLTFMEVTERNEAALLGFKDGETAVFVNEDNYKRRFEEYLAHSDDARWEEIALAGRAYAMESFSNDRAVEQLVDLILHAR
jgi:hypothetical protein